MSKENQENKKLIAVITCGALIVRRRAKLVNGFGSSMENLGTVSRDKKKSSPKTVVRPLLLQYNKMKQRHRNQVVSTKR